MAEYGNGLLLAVVGFQHPRPLRPCVAGSAGLRRAGHHFQLHDARAALTDGSAYAVVARVAAADDQHLFALGRDGLAVGEIRVQQALGHAGQVVHGEADSLGVPSGYADIPGLFCAAAQNYRVIILFQLLGGDVPPHVGVGDKLDALVFQNLHPAVNDPLFQLHVGNAVHQQAAHPVGTLVHGHLVAALVQEVGNGQPGGTGADHRHPLSGTRRWRNGVDRAAFVAVLHDRPLVFLHRHGRPRRHAAGAGGFAQRRADPAGEFRIAVGGNEPLRRQVPPPLIYQIVPLGDEVI